MQTSMSQFPAPSVSLEQALTDIIESIAVEETALSGVLSSEGDILQKAKNAACTTDELICVNESVNSIIKNVARLQVLLQFKLDDIGALLKRIADIDEDFDLEE